MSPQNIRRTSKSLTVRGMDQFDLSETIFFVCDFPLHDPGWIKDVCTEQVANLSAYEADYGGAALHYFGQEGRDTLYHLLFRELRSLC